MESTAKTVEQYLLQLPEDRIEVINELRTTILKNLPSGFKEQISYGMIGYVVPHDIYPAGYHCNPTLPIPFISIASQKNFISIYHMGLYADTRLSDWFVSEYSKHSKAKLDMGKSCIRFKKTAEIPFELIGVLCQKISVEDWISTYETTLKK
ncbi:DUF1801 domain-containing protein [Flavobacterium sp.]